MTAIITKATALQTVTLDLEGAAVIIPDLDTLLRLMREATRLAEEIASPLAPNHSFIKPRNSLDGSPRKPPDKLPVYPIEGSSCPLTSDKHGKARR